jgi:hypothetical protein
MDFPERSIFLVPVQRGPGRGQERWSLYLASFSQRARNCALMTNIHRQCIFSGFGRNNCILRNARISCSRDHLLAEIGCDDESASLSGHAAVVPTSERRPKHKLMLNLLFPSYRSTSGTGGSSNVTPNLHDADTKSAGSKIYEHVERISRHE